MNEIYRYIDDHLDESVALLMELCRQPSISAQGVGLDETAELVRRLLAESGVSARTLPIAGGPPVIYGELAGESPAALLFYNHYDVQPPEPLELWTSPAFEPAIREGRIFGRGTADNKGDIAARIAAIRAFLAVRGRLPVAVKFCIEGEEEVGSPHLLPFVREHRDLLGADACIWEGGEVNWQGQPQVVLGVKGLAYVDLAVRTAARDVHSSLATLVPNAAWRLIWALSTLKDADEHILIEGFYDDVQPLSDAELKAAALIPPEDEELRASLELRALVKGLTGAEAVRRHLFEPTCTICGIVSGYTGEGTKTVSPCLARAKVGFRLVPHQRPDDIVAKLRRHLDRHGFDDVAMLPLEGEPPARTSLDSPFVTLMVDAARQVYGTEPVVVPTMAATGPMAYFIDELRMPVAMAGIGYPDQRMHAPDENVRLEDFRRGIKYIAAIMERLGQSQGGGVAGPNLQKPSHKE